MNEQKQSEPAAKPKRREDGFPYRVKWRGQIYEVPSTEQLEEMVCDGVCETPDGDVVEPDHPHSWLRLLGLI